MKIFKSLYLKDVKKAKMLYATFLLAELIYLNYSFSNKEYDGATGGDVWNLMINTKYSESEKEKIIKNAMILLNIKYGIKLNDDLIEQFNSLNITK